MGTPEAERLSFGDSRHIALKARSIDIRAVVLLIEWQVVDTFTTS